MITRTYRGKTTVVDDGKLEAWRNKEVGAAYLITGYDRYDARFAYCKAHITADKLLPVAKTLLEQAGENAGIQLRVAIVVDGKVAGWA